MNSLYHQFTQRLFLYRPVQLNACSAMYRPRASTNNRFTVQKRSYKTKKKTTSFYSRLSHFHLIQPPRGKDTGVSTDGILVYPICSRISWPFTDSVAHLPRSSLVILSIVCVGQQQPLAVSARLLQ